MTLIEFSEHPEYLEYKDNWELYRLLYEGDQKKLKNGEYLWYHELESTAGSYPSAAPNSPQLAIPPGLRVRMIREERSTYTNEIEPVISRWQSIFFKKAPEADEEVKRLFGDDIDDVTGDGKSLNTFINDSVLANRLIYGRPIIMTDAPSLKAKTLLEQKALGLRPFFKMLNPLEVKDWEIETSGARKGQFKWLRCEYFQIESRENSRTKPVVNLYSKELIFNVATDGKIGTYTYNIYRLEKEENTNKAQWNLVSSDDFIGFPNLPVRSIECEESWIKDSAPLARKLYNLESGRDQMLYYQMYQRTFIAASISEQEKMAMASYVIGFLPEGAVVHTIEPASTQSIDKNIEETKMALRAVAFNQQRQMQIASKAVEGAETQREYKEALTSVVKSELETLETLVNNAIKDYAWFKEQNADFKGEVKFSRDVELDDLVEEIMFYQQLKDDVRQFPTWRKSLLKKFAHAQNLPEILEIEKEIESTQLETQPTGGTDVASRRQRLQESVNGRPQEETPKPNEPAS